MLGETGTTATVQRIYSLWTKVALKDHCVLFPHFDCIPFPETISSGRAIIWIAMT